MPIPKSVREQAWLIHIGPRFQATCTIPWCNNIMSVFDFHAGHDHPDSKGGEATVDNIQPICARCNLSMGNKYTIREWGRKFNGKQRPSLVRSCISSVLRHIL